AAPVVILQLELVIRDRSIGGNRPVTGEHTRSEKLLRRRRCRELEISVLETTGNSVVEEGWQIVDVRDRNRTFDLVSTGQSQRHASDHAKQSVATDRQ